ncbi:MAG: hypothetical protein ACOH2M_09445 [Cypionkella sp.]
MRLILALLFSLMLAATSVSSAVMHSEMQGATEMTICGDAGGAGVSTVLFDATGKPMAQHHRCPDCLAALATALLPEQTILIAPHTSAHSIHPATQTIGTGRPSPAAIARGPPPFA